MVSFCDIYIVLVFQILVIIPINHCKVINTAKNKLKDYDGRIAYNNKNDERSEIKSFIVYSAIKPDDARPPALRTSDNIDQKRADFRNASKLNLKQNRSSIATFYKKPKKKYADMRMNKNHKDDSLEKKLEKHIETGSNFPTKLKHRPTTLFSKKDEKIKNMGQNQLVHPFKRSYLKSKQFFRNDMSSDAELSRNNKSVKDSTELIQGSGDSGNEVIKSARIDCKEAVIKSARIDCKEAASNKQSSAESGVDSEKKEKLSKQTGAIDEDLAEISDGQSGETESDNENKEGKLVKLSGVKSEGPVPMSALESGETGINYKNQVPHMQSSAEYIAYSEMKDLIKPSNAKFEDSEEIVYTQTGEMGTAEVYHKHSGQDTAVEETPFKLSGTNSEDSDETPNKLNGAKTENSVEMSGTESGEKGTCDENEEETPAPHFIQTGSDEGLGIFSYYTKVSTPATVTGTTEDTATNSADPTTTCATTTETTDETVTDSVATTSASQTETDTDGTDETPSTSETKPYSGLGIFSYYTKETTNEEPPDAEPPETTITETHIMNTASISYIPPDVVTTPGHYIDDEK